MYVAILVYIRPVVLSKRIFRLILFHINNETYVGRGLVLDLVRLRESRATRHKMKTK